MAQMTTNAEVVVAVAAWPRSLFAHVDPVEIDWKSVNQPGQFTTKRS